MTLNWCKVNFCLNFAWFRDFGRQGEHPYIWAQSHPPPVDLSVGVIRLQIAAEWLHIAQRSQWRAYRKPPPLFRMVPSLTPTTSPSPQNGGSICPPLTYANDHISATGDPIHFMFCSRVGFSGTADLMVLFTVRTNPRWRPPPWWKNFKWRYLRKRSSDPLSCLVIGWGFRRRRSLF